jgi:hypothetical protein
MLAVFIRRAAKWLVGYVMFWGPILGTIAGFSAAETPWWAWACVALIALQFVCLIPFIPGFIRNGYFGATPSTSPWEHIRAAEEEASYQNFVKAVEEKEARRHRAAPGNYERVHTRIGADRGTPRKPAG